MFEDSTDAIYTAFGVSATHYQGQADIGTSCTVLMEDKGQEETSYGVAETAAIVVRKAEVAAPERGQTFDVNGKSWRIEYLLGADEGTNELETACACVSAAHLGMGH